MFLFLVMLPLNAGNMLSMLMKYLDQGYTSQLVTAVLCGSISVLLAFGSIKMVRKVNTLKKEKIIRE
jgi:hypothetical protein